MIQEQFDEMEKIEKLKEEACVLLEKINNYVPSVPFEGWKQYKLKKSAIERVMLELTGVPMNERNVFITVFDDRMNVLLLIKRFEFNINNRLNVNTRFFGDGQSYHISYRGLVTTVVKDDVELVKNMEN